LHAVTLLALSDQQPPLFSKHSFVSISAKESNHPHKRKRENNAALQRSTGAFMQQKKRGIAHKPARKQTSGSVVSSNPEHTAVSTAFFPSLPKWKVNMLT
jgi:hypothetical protein